MSVMPEVVGVVFKKKGEYGDFGWMIFQEKFRNALFVFNDDEARMNSAHKGGGNACVRPYNYVGYGRNGFTFVRSVGIPTGPRRRGYRDLEEGKLSIDYGFDILRKVLKQHQYDTIFFSEGKGGLIGCGIFDVPVDVRIYITRCLRGL